MKKKEKYFRWSYKLLIALAQAELEIDRLRQTDPTDPKEWPGNHQWHELVPTSHSILMRRARIRAGIGHQEYLHAIRSGVVNVEDIYEAAIEASKATPKEQRSISGT